MVWGWLQSQLSITFLGSLVYYHCFTQGVIMEVNLSLGITHTARTLLGKIFHPQP